MNFPLALVSTLSCMLPAFAAPSVALVSLQSNDAITDVSPVAASAEQESAGVLASFDISDLTGSRELAELRGAVAQEDLPQSVRMAAFDQYLKLKKVGAAEHAADAIVSSIEAFVEPRPMKGFRVASVDPGELTLVGSGAQRLWVAEFLRASRSFDGLIEVQVKFLRVPEGHLKELVGERSGSALDEVQLKALVELAGGLDGVETVTAPRIVTEPRSLARMSVLEEMTYIRDFELTLIPGVAKQVADPVIETLRTGLELEVRGVPVADRQLALSVGFEYSALDQPIPTQELRLGVGGQKVTVQAPKVWRTKGSARFDIEQGGALAIATVDPKPSAPVPGAKGTAAVRRDILVLITAKRTDGE